jgi:hypothetical protein
VNKAALGIPMMGGCAWPRRNLAEWFWTAGTGLDSDR